MNRASTITSTIDQLSDIEYLIAPDCCLLDSCYVYPSKFALESFKYSRVGQIKTSQEFKRSFEIR